MPGVIGWDRTCLEVVVARSRSVDEAQVDLDQLIDEVQHEPIPLTRGGKVVAILSAPDDPPRTGLYAYIQRFRATTDLEELASDDVFDGLRDRSPGRDVPL